MSAEKAKKRTRHSFKRLQDEVSEELRGLQKKVGEANSCRKQDYDWLVALSALLKQEACQVRPHVACEQDICQECFMPLESGSECICSSIDERTSEPAYGQEASRNFEAEKELLAKRTEKSLAQVEWALQASLKEAGRLHGALQETPRLKFEEAAQAASDGLLWQREQAQRVENRAQLVMQAKLAMDSIEQMLNTQHAAPERLATGEQETIDRCSDTLAVHQKLAQAAEQFRSSFEQDFEKRAMQLSEQLRDRFQPILADGHGLLTGISQFLCISHDQIQRESASGTQLYTEKLERVNEELSRFHEAGIAGEDTDNVDYQELLSKRTRIEGELETFQTKVDELVCLVAQSRKLLQRLKEELQRLEEGREEEEEVEERPAKRLKTSEDIVSRPSFFRWWGC